MELGASQNNFPIPNPAVLMHNFIINIKICELAILLFPGYLTL